MALRGIQVIELAGLAPGPYCGMLLNDFGARVIRIDKASEDGLPAPDLIGQGKLSVALNLKRSEGIQALKKLASVSDVLIDPFRAGVMEKLGLGPGDLCNDNSRLIYARLTGYGQDGPMSNQGGHDINFTSISGVLSMLGPRPQPPLNILGDFGGGGLMCCFGILAALVERATSGKGQVVDASMSRGAAYLSSWILQGLNTSLWDQPRGENLLDGGYWAYGVYETLDKKWMAVGSLEKKFFDNLLLGLDLTQEEKDELCFMDIHNEVARQIVANKFKQHTQEHWTQVFKDLDACVTPVLTPLEAVDHEHNSFQKNLVLTETGVRPSPEPQLNRTPGVSGANVPTPGEHTEQILKEIGYSADEISAVLAANSPNLTSKL